MVRLTSWRFRDTENLVKLINILLPITDLMDSIKVI